jgi:hypothetical protein
MRFHLRPYLAATGIVAGLFFNTVGPAISGIFANKQIVMIIGFAAGGGTDAAGRLLAAYLSKHLPDAPVIIVRNIPGASGMTAMNYFLQQTAPDGLTIAMATGSQVDPINYRKIVGKYDPKALAVVGGFANGGSAMLISKAATPRLFDKTAAPVIMGSTAALPRNAMQMTLWGIEYLGWNARWVVGYPGTNEIIAALSRDEIDMTATGNAFQIRQQVEGGKVGIVTQSGAYHGGHFTANADFGDAPVFPQQMAGKIQDPLAAAAFAYWANIMITDKWVGLAAGTPPDILQIYRDAFEKVAVDKDFLAAGSKIKEDFIPVHADDMAALIAQLADTPPEALDFTTTLMEKQGLHAKQGD